MTFLKNQQGFTLIEIMVALTIGLFLTAGVTQVFLTTNQTNRTQENLSRMQENARFAMHFLTEDIREADYYIPICGNGDVLKNAYNNLDYLAASDAQFDFGSMEGISGQDNLAPLGTDSITLRFIKGLKDGAEITNQPGVTMKINASAKNASNMAKQGSIVIATDCINSDIFQNVNNSGGAQAGSLTLTISGGNNISPGNKNNGLVTNYDNGNPNSKAYYLSDEDGISSITYEIEKDGNEIPGLVRNGEQLVANIENMQILYGERLASGNMYYVPAGTVGLDMTKVVSIKVSLLVRSPDDNIVVTPQTYFYNNVDVSGADIADNRLRKVYTSTITVRNRLN